MGSLNHDNILDNGILHVELTREDIRKGELRNCAKCPMALAIKRALTKIGFKPDNISVGYGAIIINKIKFSPIPVKVSAFIADFDSGMPNEYFKPFSFKLNFKHAKGIND